MTLAVLLTCQIVAAQTVNNPTGTWQRKNLPWPLAESDSGTIGSKTGENYQYIDYYWTLSPHLGNIHIQEAKSKNLQVLTRSLEDDFQALESWDYVGTKLGVVEEYVTLEALGQHNINKPHAAAYAVSTLESVSTSKSPVSDGVACNSGNGRETTQGAIGTVTIHLVFFDLHSTSLPFKGPEQGSSMTADWSLAMSAM